MNGLEFTVLSLAIILASCLQGSIGFGMGMVAAPIVALTDPELLPGMLIVLAFVLTLVVSIRERDAISMRGAGWAQWTSMCSARPPGFCLRWGSAMCSRATSTGS